MPELIELSDVMLRVKKKPKKKEGIAIIIGRDAKEE
jgi:hypothetical protein